MSNTNIVISDKCIQCGSCIGFSSKWIEETSDGVFAGKNGVFVEADDPDVAKLISVCPVGAISIDASIKRETAKNTVEAIITQLESMNGLPEPTRNDMKFNVDEYSIGFPYPSGERRYNYSSERAAENAAENEFNRIAYSQIDRCILKIISEYRVKKVTPYFSGKMESGSVYAAYNARNIKLLSEAKDLLAGEGIVTLPSDFCSFDVFPDKDTLWKMLNKGELISDEMVGTIRSEFDSSSYSSLSSYSSNYDTDEMESYEGEGFFGGSKYKSKYCYYNVYAACRELASDIKSACRYKDDKIEERAVEIASELIKEYNKLMAAEIKRKIAAIKAVI